MESVTSMIKYIWKTLPNVILLYFLKYKMKGAETKMPETRLKQKESPFHKS